MTSKLDLTVGFSLGCAAHFLGNQPGKLLSLEPISPWALQLIQESQEAGEVLAAMANTTSLHGGSSHSALAAKQVVQVITNGVHPPLDLSCEVAKTILNTMQPWKKTADTAGQIIISSELIWNFLTYLNSDQRIQFDDVVWAAIRGAVAGACIAAVQTQGSPREIQIPLGAATGCGYAVLSSTVGAIAGRSMRKIVNCFQSKALEERKWVQLAGAGAVIVYANPLFPVSLQQAVGAGIGAALVSGTFR